MQNRYGPPARYNADEVNLSSKAPSAALPLRQALERYGDPVCRQAWESACAELKAAGGPTSIVSMSFWEDEGAQRDHKLRRALMRRRDQSERAYVSSFWSRIVAGELLAWGRRGSPEATFGPIDAAFRYLLPIIDADIIRGPDKLLFYDVRIAHRDAIAAETATPGMVARGRIDNALKQRIAQWNATEPPPTKALVMSEMTKALGALSKREFESRWAALVPDQWKKPGVRRKPNSEVEKSRRLSG